MQQLSFPDIVRPAPPPQPAPAVRPFVFFCILPSPADAAATARRAREVCGDGDLARRLFPESRLHMTLNPLGTIANAEQPLVAGLRAAAARVSMAPFDLVLTRAMSFGREESGGRRALVLRPGDDDQPVIALQRAIWASMQAVGFDGPVRPYTPHVTLLYDRRHVAERPIEPVVWRVRQFALILSLRGRSTYIPLGRWTLSRRADARLCMT